MNVKRICTLLLILSLIVGSAFTSVPTSAAPGDPGKIEAESYTNMS